jgi:manganese-dependent ADP-ribose/CDP-alcohol diphosphatase
MRHVARLAVRRRWDSSGPIYTRSIYAMATQCHGSPQAPHDGALFTFGLVADVQAAFDVEDGTDEGRCQRYSTATARLAKAVNEWLTHFERIPDKGSLPPRVPPPSFVLSLGDIVDGRTDEVTTTQDLAHVLAQYQRLPRHCPAVHTIGNHCLKFLPREKLLKALGMPASYYRVPLTTGWALLVLDTTDLSTHGWAKGSPEARAAEAYLREHGGADRIQRYNGGIGSTQQAWLEAELALAHATETRLIVASHHCLAHGACRETHRAWNGDAIAGMLEASGVVKVALAGHDHEGGFRQHTGGVPFVTLPALLEAQEDGNAFALASVHRDRIVIDGLGTAVPSHTLPFRVG